MNRVFMLAEDVSLPAWSKAARSFILKTLNLLNYNNWELSVVFCGDSFIRSLNRTWRGKDKATDVLSFPQGEQARKNGRPYLAGDIVISLETLPVNAAYFGVSEDEELRRILTHGILHLAGYAHTVHDLNGESAAAEPMFALQESILAALKDETIAQKNNT